MGGFLERLAAAIFRLINRFVVWHRLPFLISLTNLVLLRFDLRHRNLYGIQRVAVPPAKPHVQDLRGFRSADGSHNDLGDPSMGQADARFGRNVPIAETFGEQPPRLYEPNPRLISKRLLARGDGFKPVPHLNVLVPAWLQFMVHDWFSHGENARPDDPKLPPEVREPLKVPLPEGDDWPDDPILVFRTKPDPNTGPEDEGKPVAYRNVETHWWDASQLYGSSQKRIDQVRKNPETGEHEPDGKLHLDAQGHLPLMQFKGKRGRAGEIELSGVNGNWWIGLSLMHTLFAREHNLICDRLKLEYPNAGGDWLFGKARLIVAGLLAKIHTVEWTPALLDTPTMRYAMRANWWGLLGESFARGYGRVSPSDLMNGILGAVPDHHAAPYAMTEEFNAVYRMHSLMPDHYEFRRHGDDTSIATKDLIGVAGENTHKIYQDVSLVDALYSLGTSRPGLLTLHNFPETLRNLPKQPPSNRRVDLATIDILRDRERGVPRYCAFRRHLRMTVPKSFYELAGGDREIAEELQEIYDRVEDVDLLIGCAAEKWPKGFGFSDTAFRIFILMASRRLKSDRFFTTDYTPEVYTPVGLRWIADNGMISVLLRHFPELAESLVGVKNAFSPWNRRT